MGVVTEEFSKEKAFLFEKVISEKGGKILDNLTSLNSDTKERSNLVFHASIKVYVSCRY